MQRTIELRIEAGGPLSRVQHYGVFYRGRRVGRLIDDSGGWLRPGRWRVTFGDRAKNPRRGEDVTGLLLKDGEFNWLRVMVNLQTRRRNLICYMGQRALQIGPRYQRDLPDLPIFLRFKRVGDRQTGASQ